MTWEILKSAIAEYYEETVDPYICFRELSNITQGRTKDIESYMNSLLELVERDFMRVDCWIQ